MKRKQQARTDFVRIPQLSNLELLHASNVTHNYPPHIHEQQCVVIVRQGSETTTIRGQVHTSLPGTIFIVNPEEIHSSVSVEAEYQVFKIQAAEFQRIASEVLRSESGQPCFRDFEIHDAHMFRALVALYDTLEQSNSMLQKESQFISAISRLIERHNKGKSSNRDSRYSSEEKKVDLVREYLKASYAENVSLEHLTLLTSLGRFSLLRAFANRVGVPPHEFQTQIRIAHARELIRQGCSLSEAALRTGFCDQSHLSRHFKRIVGMTPGEYFSGCNFVQESIR